MTTFWLSTHLGYACRHSGACCTSGWAVPIEHVRAAKVRRRIDAGEVRPAALPWLEAPDAHAPDEVAGTLARLPSGTCVFHRPSPAGGCAIHATRPVSCEHFPYSCVLDPRGVHVTLSHVCPTAARLLFLDQSPVGVVAGPPVFGPGRVPEGLDARDSLPPARDAASLMSWDEVTRWERDLVRQLATDHRLPHTPDSRAFERARAAVPAPLHWPEAPTGLEAGWAEDVAPAWSSLAPVIGRYLAARAHASWALFLGRRLDDVRRAIDLARVVLQVEAVRQCRRARRVLDATALLAAIRQADLLLLHYADPAALHGC